MTLWSWIAVGIAAFLVVSAAFGLVVAAILARISREVSELLESAPELLESELLATAPLARERASLEEAEDDAPVGRTAGYVTHRSGSA
jgi:phosphate/sulfate permease